jgi:hypothetical protein
MLKRAEWRRPQSRQNFILRFAEATSALSHTWAVAAIFAALSPTAAMDRAGPPGMVATPLGQPLAAVGRAPSQRPKRARMQSPNRMRPLSATLAGTLPGICDAATRMQSPMRIRPVSAIKGRAGVGRRARIFIYNPFQVAVSSGSPAARRK